MNKKVGIVISSVLLAVAIALIIIGSLIKSGLQDKVNKSLVLNTENENIWKNLPKPDITQNFVFYSFSNILDFVFEGKAPISAEIADSKYDSQRKVRVEKNLEKPDLHEIDLSVKYDSISTDIPNDKFPTINLEGISLWNKLKNRSKATITANLLFQQLNDLENHYYFKYLAENSPIESEEAFVNFFNLKASEIGRLYDGINSSFHKDKALFYKSVVNCKSAESPACDDATSKYQVTQVIIDTINKAINGKNELATPTKFALNQFANKQYFQTGIVEENKIYGKEFGTGLEFLDPHTLSDFLNYKLNKSGGAKNNNSLFYKSNFEKIFPLTNILKELGLDDTSAVSFQKYLDNLKNNNSAEIYSFAVGLAESFEELSNTIGQNLLIAKLHSIKEEDFKATNCYDILSKWAADKEKDTTDLLNSICKLYDVKKFSNFSDLFRILVFSVPLNEKNITQDQVIKLRKQFINYISSGITEFFKSLGETNYTSDNYRDYEFSTIGLEQLIFGELLKKLVPAYTTSKISSIYPELSWLTEYKIFNPDTKLEIADLKNNNLFDALVHYNTLLTNLDSKKTENQKLIDAKFLNFLRKVYAQDFLKLQTNALVKNLIKGGDKPLEDSLFIEANKRNYYNGGFPELPNFVDPINVFTKRYDESTYFTGTDDIKSVRSLKYVNKGNSNNVVKILKNESGIADDNIASYVSPIDKEVPQKITKVSDGFSFQSSIPSNISFLFTPIGSVIEATEDLSTNVNFFKKFQLRTFKLSSKSFFTSDFFDAPISVTVDPSSSLSVENYSGYTLKSEIIYSLTVNIPEDSLFPKAAKPSSFKLLSTTYTLDYSKEDGKFFFEDLYNKLFAIKTIYFFAAGLLILGLSLLIFFILSIYLDKDEEEEKEVKKDSKTSLVDINDSSASK